MLIVEEGHSAFEASPFSVIVSVDKFSKHQLELIIGLSFFQSEIANKNCTN
jgi:hypothetical protein